MNQRYPISFQKKKEYESSDFRFIDVTIDVMHTGANRNKTSFTKEAINKAVPTICNMPILGYVVDEMDDEDKDFKGHEHELRVTDTDIKYVYAGHAYGVIPESCNPRWVIKDDGTGTEREYLRVNGLIWTKFNDPVDIFARDGTKNHSVELTDMACGPADKEGNTPVSDFKFDGCCILSTTDPKIQPAMTGSCITAEFSVEDITSQIRDRLYEYQAIQQNDPTQENEKGDTTPMTENDKNMQTAQGADPTTGTSPAVTDPITDEPAATTEGEGEGTTTTDNTVTEPTTTDPESAVAQEPDADPEPTTDGGQQEFTLTTEQLLGEINEALSTYKIPSDWDPEYMVPRYWMNDVQGDEVIVMDCSTYKLMGIPYSMNGDNVVLNFDNSKRKKVSYEDWDEGEVLPGVTAAFSEVNAKITEMAAKVTELTKEFNDATAAVNEMKPKLEAYQKAEADAAAAADKAKRDELFSVMDEKLGANAEYIALKDNKDLGYSELETKCYALVGRMSAEFSYVPNTNNRGTVRFGVGGTQNGSDNAAYGGLIEHYRSNK